MQKNESKEMIIAAIIYGFISFLFGLCGIWFVVSARDEKYLKNPSNVAPLVFDCIGGFLGWSLIWPLIMAYDGYLLTTGRALPGNGST